MQENFHEANDPGVVDSDAGVTEGADCYGQGQTLQPWEIHMDIKPLKSLRRFGSRESGKSRRSSRSEGKPGSREMNVMRRGNG